MQSFPTRHAWTYMHKQRNFLVEAALLTDDNASEISNWANGAQVVEEGDALEHGGKQEGLNVKTPQGNKRASVGMFVVKNGGNFYVVKRGEFESLYTTF